jgi:DNA repair protein RadC
VSTDPPESLEAFGGEPAELRKLVAAARPTSWEGGSQWPSPQSVLREFLEVLGVERPGQVANTLIRDLGSLSGVLSASWWQLRRSVGFGVAGAIRSARDLMRAALAEEVCRGPVVANKQQLLDLLKLELGARRHERLIAIYVDSSLHVLRIEIISNGSARQAPAPIQKIVHVGFDVGAAGLFLIHNHPSGNPEPSRADRELHARLYAISRHFDMYLIESLIVAGDTICSILK